MGGFVRLPNRQSNYATAMATLFCLSSHVGSASAQTSNPPAIVEVCAPCHGINGTGGDVEKPNLAGQKSIYFREQLLTFRSGKRKHPDMKLTSGGHLYLAALVPEAGDQFRAPRIVDAEAIRVQS